jgi:hypothetical protein
MENKTEDLGHAYMTQDMENEPIVEMVSDKKISRRHVYDKPFTIRLPERSKWKEWFEPEGKGGLIWFTDGCKTIKGTGAGVYCYGTKRKLSCFSLGHYTTVIQAEVYAIKVCADESIGRNYKNRNIYIQSDSQAAIKALDKHQITSKLVLECHQSLTQLARHNRVQLI